MRNIYISINKDRYGNYVLHELTSGLSMKYMWYSKRDALRLFKRELLHLPPYTKGVIITDHTKDNTVYCGRYFPRKVNY